MPGADLFERLERVIARFPEKKPEMEPLVWPWLPLEVERRHVAAALHRHLGDRSPMRLIPYLPAMDSWARGEVVETLARNKQHVGDAPDARQARDAIFALRSTHNRPNHCSPMWETRAISCERRRFGRLPASRSRKPKPRGLKSSSPAKQATCAGG